MGLFNLFKKKSKDEPVQATREEQLLADIDIDESSLDFGAVTIDIKAVRLEIAENLLYQDETALCEANKCIFNLPEYVQEYKNDYSKRLIETNADKDTLKWIGVTDCIIRNNYAVELDYKCEKADFLDAIKKLKCTEKLNITITPAMENLIAEDGNICDWSSYLDSVWADNGICIGAIDIDSDSYVIFPIRVEKLNKVSALANSIKHRITYAQIT